MTARTHVALVTPWETGGGIANYSRRFRDALEDTGVNVSVVPIGTPSTWNPWRFNDTIERIPADTDVVHVQYEAGVFGRLVVSGVCTPSFFARLARENWPVVTTVHEVHRFDRDAGWITQGVLRMRDTVLERIVLSSSETTIVHTEEAEEILKDRHGRGWQVERMRHPVDKRVGPPVDKDAARAEFGLGKGPVLLTFGWVESKKRYEDVVRVLPELPNAVYLIAGEPRTEGDESVLKEIRNLSERLGVADRVRHLGYVEDDELPLVFGATDLAIVPYTHVTQSGAVNTALAYQCPVVARSLPAFEELSRAYECILTYADPESLLYVLEAVLDDETLYSLEQSAKQYAKTETWEAFASDTQVLYQNL
jgi:glycosyltransferase involved in cell wall biosynthesis